VGGWPHLRVPVIKGVFIPRSPDERCPEKSIPADEILWTMEKGVWIMIHHKEGILTDQVRILSAPVDFATAKEITGFKIYKPPLVTFDLLHTWRPKK
jgi:hypothetical protein